MKLEYLEYIAEVKRCRSISRAAKNLYTTQPTISIAIQNVEDELGIKIFNRSNTGVELTTEGKQLYEKIEQILSSMEEMKSISQKKPIETINLLAVPEVCNNFTIDLVEEMSKTIKDISVNFKEMRTGELVSSLIGNHNDVGIGCYTDASKKKIVSQLVDHDFIVKEIIHDNMVVFLSRRDKDSFKSSLTMNDLDKKTPILFVDNEPMSDVSGVNIHKGKARYLTFSDKSSIKNAVQRNMGYAILPSLMGIDDVYIKTGLISMIPLKDSSTKLTTFLAYPKKTLTEKEQQFIKRIEKLAEKTQKRIDNLSLNDETAPQNDQIQLYY